MPYSLQESVIVITGAASGIGRATACCLAKVGAKLLLASRRANILEEVASECRQLGGEASALSLDVTNAAAVQGLADEALQRFGRLDVWINDAAVSLFAKFEDAPLETYLRVFETNLFGYIYGARAALPIFKKQRSGVLINIDSIVGGAPQPYTSAYVASKYAIRGLSACLRMELNLEKINEQVHVCTVMPATIDTPFFQHAANYTGRMAKAMNPVYTAEQVAQSILELIQKPHREVIVGEAGYLMVEQNKHTPDLYEKTMAIQVDKDHLSPEKTATKNDGNLFEPMQDEYKISGNWKHTGHEGAAGVIHKLSEAVHLPGS